MPARRSLGEGGSTLLGKSAARRRRLTTEAAIKAFFGSNALIAIVVLALITIFLFREGFGFFGQNLANLRLYRRAGLEYVDIIRAKAQQHAALSRNLGDVRLQESQASANAATVGAFDRFAAAFSDSAAMANSEKCTSFILVFSLLKKCVINASRRCGRSRWPG